MHDVTTQRGEPIRDSEGLAVTGLPKGYVLNCTCGWTETVQTPDEAIGLAEAHRNENR